MHWNRVALGVLACLVPYAAADIISDVCGNASKGSFCVRNGTALVSCAARTQTTCGVNEFCQVQGARLARCEPISRDAEDVCRAVQAQGLPSAIRCSSEVPNVRISCPNALISKCPSGKVCVQSNSRYARCELPAYTSTYTVMKTFAAEMDPVSVSQTYPVTMTTSVALTTTMDVLETVVTTPAVTISTMPEWSTEVGTLIGVSTRLVPGFATVLQPTTLVHIGPSTYVSVEYATAVETRLATPIVTTSAPVHTAVQTLSETVPLPLTRTVVRSTNVAIVTAVETINLSTEVPVYSTVETIPLATLTETVIGTPIFTILPWTDAPITESVTLSATVPMWTNVPTTLPDLTLTVSHTEHVMPTATLTQEAVTPMVTMTAIAEMPHVVQHTETAVWPEIVIVPTTSVSTMTAVEDHILVLPTTDVQLVTEVATATPWVTIRETQPITFTPMATAVLPTSDVQTLVWTSAVPGTAVLPMTSLSTDMTTSTHVLTSTYLATTTAVSADTTLVPTIVTDTYIVCSTPTPTVYPAVPDYHAVSVTQSPIGVVTQVVGTRTRGPNAIRTQTSVIAGIPTVVPIAADFGMEGLRMQQQAAIQPAMIKVQGECTTSYRVKFGYSTVAAIATAVHAYPVESVQTAVTPRTSVLTSVAYQTNVFTAATVPVQSLSTASLGVFTTISPAQPTHLFEVVDKVKPTVIAYTPEPLPATEIGHVTTTVPFAYSSLATNVAQHTATLPVTAVRVSTLTAALPTSTVVLSYAPSWTTTALVTEVPPTVTATIPAETTLEAHVTRTVQLPPIAPVSVISTYVSKYTKMYTDADVQTITAVVGTTDVAATPTIVSTVNVYPPVVQITLTAHETVPQTAATLIVTTQQAAATEVVPAPAVQTTLVPTQILATQLVTRVVSTASVAIQTPMTSTVTSQVSILPMPAAVQTRTAMSTAVEVSAQTMLSTRTFDALPTGHLIIRAKSPAPNRTHTVSSVQTAVASILPPSHSAHAHNATKQTAVTVKSTAATAASTSAPVAPSNNAKPKAVTLRASTSTAAAASSPSPLPESRPVKPIGMSTTCPAFTIGAAQYRVTAPGSAASGEAACAALGKGWALATIADHYEFSKVGEHICTPSYYQSWAGDAYGDACLAMYPGGATAVPAQGCTGKLASLCKFVTD